MSSISDDESSVNLNSISGDEGSVNFNSITDDESSVNLDKSTLVGFGERVKRIRSLAPESQAAFDMYCHITSKEKRAALLYHALLEVKDTLEKPDKKWVMTVELKKEIGIHTKIFLLSPLRERYRGSGGPEEKLMKVGCVVGLPADADLHSQKEVLQLIGEQLTYVRGIIKKKLQASNQVGQPKVNIEDLTKSILDKIPVEATRELYKRVALQKAGSDYWKTVDNFLGRYESYDLKRILEQVYENDKEVYGYPPFTRSEEMKKQFKIPNVHAASIQNGAEGSKKRKRTQENSF